MRIGIVGYSQQGFDKEKAIELLRSILIQEASIHLDITIVSGLTTLGVPAIAYSLAKELNLKTMGLLALRLVSTIVFHAIGFISLARTGGMKARHFWLQSIN